MGITVGLDNPEPYFGEKGFQMQLGELFGLNLMELGG
jgi:hypothetical protein